MCDCGRWISVEDRSPHNARFVLAWSSGGTKFGTNIAWWGGGFWHSIIDRRELHYVTHWMPLPDAPRYKRECKCEKVEVRQCGNCRHWDGETCISKDWHRQTETPSSWTYYSHPKHTCGWWEKCKCKEIPIPFHMQNDRLCFDWEEGDYCTSKVWPRKAYFSCEFIDWLNQLWRHRT